MREGAAAGQARQAQVTGRSWLASPAIVLVLGGLLLVLLTVDAPLARLAQQSINASGGSSPVWFTGTVGALGFVLAWRRPRNPLGWIFLAAAVFSTLSEDASFYTVADYRWWRTCSSRYWRHAGWHRWPRRRAATAARPVSAASSSSGC